MVKRIGDFVNRHKNVVIAFGVIVLVIMVGLITPSFAISTPVSSVVITSEKTSYENKEPGSWQVEKSGKWIGKGTARVSFDLSSILMTENSYTDIIFVLDISGSMAGDKLEKVKQDTTELLESLLSNRENRAALITFDTESRIVSGLTDDKDLLIQEVNNLTDTGDTNYYQALVNVDTILKDYQQEENREMIILFLTDGYPNEDTPNQIAQYKYLKSEYPYITINGIQYEMGDSILDPIKEISDNQFIADMESLNNVLFDASVVPVSYDNFRIIDYIENDYFILESEDDITVSVGEVTLEEENGLQKITWTIPNYRSGSSASLFMDLKLKDELIGQGGVYPTNNSEQVISQIENQSENVNSTLTPALQESYQVIYDGNAPDGCSVENVPNNEAHSVFDVVSISEEEASCSGYEFKGWEMITENVTKVNDDYFIMPESDVILRAKWGKVSISKSMDGEVSEQGDPIMKVYTSSTSTDYHSSTYKSKITSIVTKSNTEIPATAIESWDVSAAGDGSVVAYIEDDERGTGTYKVTIAGQGGIIANSNSSYLFYNFSSLESIDLTYLDTSQVTDMSSMFYLCSSLTNLNLSGFNTSNVVNMQWMFNRCNSLTILDLSHFNTSNVTDMQFMFSYCSSLTSLDLSGFNTSKVTGMSDMFYYCRSLRTLDMRTAEFNATSYADMFSRTSELTVTVKDETARSWVQDKLGSNGTAVIA